MRAAGHVRICVNLLHHLALCDVEEVDLVVHAAGGKQQVVDLGEGDAGARFVLVRCEDELLGGDADLIFWLSEYLRSVPDDDLAVPVGRRQNISFDDAESYLSDLATTRCLVGQRDLRLIRINNIAYDDVAVHVSSRDKRVISVEVDATRGEERLDEYFLKLLAYHVEYHKVAAKLGLHSARGLSALRRNECDLRAV